MENNPYHIKIEEALNSLDGIKRAEANPFLVTRVLEKMKGPASSLVKPALIWKVAASLLLIVGLNISIGFYKLNHSTSAGNPTESGYFSNHLYKY
jgi:hypothetical protein